MRFVCHAVGARPQFIKLAAVLPSFRKRFKCRVVHTGQHYDKELSQVHFSQLKIPEADWNLGVGSAPHGAQTGRMMEKLEELLDAEKPVAVVAYGDTNSTIAAALTASKLGIPIFHVEAGLRSFDRSTPEEVNRVVTDHVSKLLFCPSSSAAGNLKREGITDGVHIVGDVMIDLLLSVAGGDVASFRRASLDVREISSNERTSLRRGKYYFATLHRAENVDSEERLLRILGALSGLPAPVVFPLHPRTAKAIAAVETGAVPAGLVFVPPTGYRETLELQANCRAVYTDSGGVQKEAFYLGVPCVTLRAVTEWEETVESGANVLVGDDPAAILAAAGRTFPDGLQRDVYGDGGAGEKIAAIVDQFLSERGSEQ